ncbi:MAG: hypothetical protein FWF03_08445 [Defluviitaleaceae bacterium]|nr:hypothetical protein [Defluviitaleaceae bacterium]
MVIAGRDTEYYTLGYDAGILDDSFPYAFDAIGAWQFDSDGAADANGRLDIAIEEFEPEYVPSIHGNYVGDALYASDGFVYAAYYYLARGSSPSGEVRMAVIGDGQVLRNEFLYEGGMGTAFYETREGALYLIRMRPEGGGTTKLLLGKFDDERKGFDDMGEWSLEGGSIIYANQRVTCARGGNDAADFVDVIYPVEGNRWMALRLRID